MANILTDTFPISLFVSGEEYPIHWDAKHCIQIMIELEKGDLTVNEQLIYLINALLDTEELPPDTGEAIKQALWFIHGGRYLEDAQAKADPVRTFSYEKDAELIYSAFSTRHGIDLAGVDMHWWRFRALFTDLGDTTFAHLCDLRRRYKLGECNEHELELIADMGSEFVIEDASEQLDWEKYKNMTAFEAAEMAGQHG